jgi:hypothetical protein
MEGGAVVVDDIQKLADEAKASGIVTKTEGNNDVIAVEGIAGKLLEGMSKTITDLSAKVDSQEAVIKIQGETITKLLSDFAALNEVAKTSEANFARVSKSIGEVREILSGSVSAPPPEPEAMNDKQKEVLEKTSRQVAEPGKTPKFKISPSGAVVYPRE